MVTGGAKRVGRAIVEKLAANGFDVAFTYLTSGDEAAEVAGAARGAGGTALPICADLTDPAAAAETVGRAFGAAFDRLDVLVNNASLYEPSPLKATTLAQVRRLTAIHLEAPLLLCQTFEPLLRASRGHVVNMIDVLAERPWPEYLAYCATKGALRTLTLGLARELAPDVTVNGIAPGVVEWPPGYPEHERKKYLKRVPLGRAGSPADVANLVHFLVTVGTYVTGDILHLDGGRSLT